MSVALELSEINLVAVFIIHLPEFTIVTSHTHSMPHMVIKTNQSSTINANNLSIIMVCMHVQAMLLERHDQKHKNFAISNVSDSHKPVFILIRGELKFPPNVSDFP